MPPLLICSFVTADFCSILAVFAKTRRPIERVIKLNIVMLCHLFAKIELCIDTDSFHFFFFFCSCLSSRSSILLNSTALSVAFLNSVLSVEGIVFSIKEDL